MSHDEELIAAARPASLKKLQAAVKAGANLEAVDDDGLTALQLLCKSKSGAMSATETEAALWLIERGASIAGVTDEDGQSLLHLAAASGGIAVIDVLAKKGLKVSRDNYGNTPLFYCVDTRTNDPKLWDRLLEIGCELTDVNDAGDTPLLEAESMSNAAAVRYFVAKGADRATRDTAGQTALERRTGSARPGHNHDRIVKALRGAPAAKKPAAKKPAAKKPAAKKPAAKKPAAKKPAAKKPAAKKPAAKKPAAKKSHR